MPFQISHFWVFMKFINTMSFNGRFILATLLTIAAVSTHAQSNIHTPYSRFGLGALDQPGSVSHFGMGGLTTPIADQNVINWNNPASYSFMDVTTLQVSGKGVSSIYTNNNASNSFRGGQINEIFFGFKQRDSKWGFAFGLTPYSTVGYGFSQESTINDTLGVIYSYRGTGGVNRATIGLSRVLNYRKKIEVDTTTTKKDSLSAKQHQFSFGSNINFLFGNVIDTSKILYDNINIYNTRIVQQNRMSGFVFDIGGLYRVPLVLTYDDKRISGGTYFQAGIKYSIETNLNSSISRVNQLYLTSGGIEFPVDTVFSQTDLKQKIAIPQNFAVGFAFRKISKKLGSLQVGLDYKIQDWKGVSAVFGSELNEDRILDAASTVSFGIDYRPSQNRSSNLVNRMQYRVGLRNTDTYLNLNQIAIEQRAVSAGISIPVLKSDSKFHLGAEYGIGGTLDTGLVKEQFWNFQVGFTFTPREPWFNQVKYD